MYFFLWKWKKYRSFWVSRAHLLVELLLHDVLLERGVLHLFDHVDLFAQVDVVRLGGSEATLE